MDKLQKNTEDILHLKVSEMPSKFNSFCENEQTQPSHYSNSL